MRFAMEWLRDVDSIRLLGIQHSVLSDFFLIVGFCALLLWGFGYGEAFRIRISDSDSDIGYGEAFQTIIRYCLR